MHHKAPVFLALLFALSTCCMAQKNEFALSIGAATATSQQTTFVGLLCPVGVQCSGPFNTSTNVGLAFEGVYSRQILHFHAASVGAEFPFVGAPSRNVSTSLAGGPALAVSQSSLFFTPSARIRLLPSASISPFFSVGGGLARLETGNAVHRGALQYGGGVDFKTPLPHLAIRGEIRDFRSVGVLENSGLTRVSPAHQNNVFAGAGVVVKF